MPNRIIRDSALTSTSLYRLSHAAERLFWRLILIADDFGRFEASPQLIKAKCFPLWPDKRMSVRTVTALYHELEQVEAVKTYVVEGRAYGFFPTWPRYQQQRATKSKYPTPADENICTQVLADSLENRDRESRIEIRDTSARTCSPRVANGSDPDEAGAVLAWLNDKAGRNYRPVPVNLDLIRARLRDGISAYQLKAIVSRKVREWRGEPKTEKWLRPATLFGKTKCEQYVGELPKEAPDATRVELPRV